MRSIKYFAQLYSDERTNRLNDRNTYDQRLSDYNDKVLSVIEEYQSSSLTVAEAMKAVAGAISSINTRGSNG